MATKSLRLDENLVNQAQRHAKVEHRSINGQMEYWAKLGKAIASKISAADAYAVVQGVKGIRLETTPSRPIDSGEVFAELEADRVGGFADKPVSSAPFYFEASVSHPGYLDKVDAKTGERQTGKFENGKFEAL